MMTVLSSSKSTSASDPTSELVRTMTGGGGGVFFGDFFDFLLLPRMAPAHDRTFFCRFSALLRRCDLCLDFDSDSSSTVVSVQSLSDDIRMDLEDLGSVSSQPSGVGVWRSENDARRDSSDLAVPKRKAKEESAVLGRGLSDWPVEALTVDVEALLVVDCVGRMVDKLLEVSAEMVDKGRGMTVVRSANSTF